MTGDISGTGGVNKRIRLFCVLVLALSWGFTLVARGVFHSRNPMTVVMALPLILAVIFMAVARERFSAVGLGLPKLRYLGLAVLLPLLQLVLIVAIGSSLGLLTYNPEHLIVSRPTPHLWLNLVLCVPALVIPWVLLTPPALILGWITHFSEEFAWRGYLFRGVSSPAGQVKGALISGAVWWAWHLPLFALSPVLASLDSGQVILTVILSLASLLGTAALYGWIYLRSGSIWAPTVLHLYWNLFRELLTGRISDGTPGLFTGDLWLMNGEGVIGMAVTAATGAVFLFLLRRAPALLPRPAFPWWADRDQE